MPYKTGGGKHLQYYDRIDGQFEEIEKQSLQKKDYDALAMIYYFGLQDESLIFHWPNENIHNKEYFDLFVKYSKQFIESSEITLSKCNYILTFFEYKDKSNFLNELGYYKINMKDLAKDIRYGTDYGTLKFSRVRKNHILCEAKTILKNYIVTSVWELQKNFSVRFVTLLPGGDKKWK